MNETTDTITIKIRVKDDGSVVFQDITRNAETSAKKIKQGFLEAAGGIKQFIKQHQKTTGIITRSQNLARNLTSLARVGNQVIHVLQDIGIISGNTAKIFKGVTSGISGIGAGFNAISTAGTGFAGILQKISGGLSIFTSGLTIATSVARGLIALFTKERDWAGEAREAMQGLPGITQQWIDKIAKLGEELGSVKKAFRQMMGEIIADTVTSTQSFETWANQVMGLFDHIGNITMDPGTGIVISREDVTNLDNAFSALVEKADLLGMHGSRAMLQIIARAKELGLVVPSIVDYIDSKFQTSLHAMGTHIETMQGTYQQNAQFLDTTIGAYITAMKGEGYSFIEIVTQMKDSLVKLKEKAQSEGTAVSAAIRDMVDLADFIDQNKTLVENIQSTRQIMEGLGDTGYLTEEAFSSFLTKTIGNFENLQAAGAGELDSLRILSPILENLIRYADSYGYSIDAQTQALIDRAREEKILNENAIDNEEKTVMLLEEIVQLLGGKIPYAMQDLADKVSISVTSIKGDLDSWENNLEGIKDQYASIEDTVIDVEATHHEKVIGNTIIEDLKEWIGKVIEINGAYYEVIDTIKIADQEYGKVIRSIDESTINIWQSDLIDIQSTIFDIIKNTAPELKGEWTTAMVGMKSDTFNLYRHILKILDTMKTCGEEDLPYWKQAFITALGDVQGHTGDFIDLLYTMQDELGIQFPDTLWNLLGTWDSVFGAMYDSTQDLYLGADGVLRTLQDIIALQGQMTAGDIGGNYGVFSEDEKIAMTLKFQQLGHLWASDRSTILSDPDWMGRFLRDLEALRGGIIDESVGQYNQFVASIRQWNAHVQAGHTWTGSGWQIPEQAAAGGIFMVGPGWPENKPGMPIGVHSDELVRVFNREETRQIIQQGFIPPEPIHGTAATTLYDMFSSPEMFQDDQGEPGIQPFTPPSPVSSQAAGKVEINITINNDMPINIHVPQGGEIDIDQIMNQVDEYMENNARGWGTKIAAHVKEELNL